MHYWLFKTEPSSWSWDDQIQKKIEPWNGVRNYQASNYMKAMEVGDLGFFYHSVSEKKIVGIVEIVRPYYPDDTDSTGRFGMVDVKAVRSLPKPVSLSDIKNDPDLQDLPLIKQSRLSVMPIPESAWRKISAMGGL